MTNQRIVLFLLFLSLTFTSLACPTRPRATDGGDSGTNGSAAGTMGAGGAMAGLAGASGGFGGAQGGHAGTSGPSAGGGDSGSHGGAGGASPTGTAGTQGSGGTSSQAGGGASGSVGNTNTCTDTTNDALNCGTCGHTCLGGACLGGTCQPILLGTVPVTDFADETVVLGGKVYVFADSSQTGNRTDVWQVDASTPETPTELTTKGQASCILNAQLFWTTYNSPEQVFSCTLSNCAATATPVVTLASGADFGNSLRCDQTNNELVWRSTTDGSDFTISRASPTGANTRVITSVRFLNDGASWGFLDSGAQADRFFYTRSVIFAAPSGTSESASLYYIATNVVNGAGVSVVTNPTGSIADILANDAIVLVCSGSSSGVAQEQSVPLPNGILSGAPPVFAPGSIVSGGGILDQTTFYGTIGSNSAVPSDGIVKCPLSGCATPTILFRGQSSPFAFTADATAIYWTTNAFSQTQGFSIWKAAK